jgi:uncharacterized protein YuzE
MKLTYDPKANAAYIYLRERGPGDELETIELSDEVNVDIAPDGRVFGIELLNANAQLKTAGEGVLVLVNQVLDKTEKVPLP